MRINYFYQLRSLEFRTTAHGISIILGMHRVQGMKLIIHKCIINSLDVHPQFDTGAAENLWRAALWPPLVYRFIK